MKGEPYKGPIASYASDKVYAAKLWKLSEDLVGEEFPL